MPKASLFLRPKAELRPPYDIQDQEPMGSCQDAIIYVQFQQGLFYKSLKVAQEPPITTPLVELELVAPRDFFLVCYPYDQ